MQNVVLEILEFVVGRLRSFDIELGVRQECALPQIVVRAFEVAQRIERQLVVRAFGVGGIDDAEEQVHWGVSRSDRRQRNAAMCAR